MGMEGGGGERDSRPWTAGAGQILLGMMTAEQREAIAQWDKEFVKTGQPWDITLIVKQCSRVLCGMQDGERDE